MSVDGLFEETNTGSILQSETSLIDLQSAYISHQNLAAERGRKVIAYEGGTSCR
jgi:hypothetical protein